MGSTDPQDKITKMLFEALLLGSIAGNDEVVALEDFIDVGNILGKI